MSFSEKVRLNSTKPVAAVLGVVAFCFTAAVTVLAILDAVRLVVAQAFFSRLSIGAACSELFGLVCLSVYLVQYTWKWDNFRLRTSLQRYGLTAACTLPSLVGAGLTLATILLVKTNYENLRRSMPGASRVLLGVELSLWSLSVIFQVAFYSIAIRESPLSIISRYPVPSQEYQRAALPEVREPTSPTSLRAFSPPFVQQELTLPSPARSSISSISLQSWRSSLQQAVRPITSRSKLVSSHSSTTRDSRRASSDVHSTHTDPQTDAFDAWDTSSVDPQARDAVLSAAPSRGTALETIPGSRPVSPARALEEACNGPRTELKTPPSIKSPPRSLRSTNVPSTSSRPTSPITDESHIHPLFRTDSPTPPPATTPGTVVVAAPLGGQTILSAPGQRGRMRSDSHTTTRSPLISSQSLQDLHDTPLSRSRATSRDPSPPSREMTPPIPDFILSASPRSSLAGYGKRKLSLQSDAER
ncbi:hypothetical protein M501DRAFT_1015429 [Patellaria atrata CBS 101060]|uniref:Uncharacterized protein n=1 Tax=Patellaria atrata CBS 101060 TaxID=1346257 RepID=A0A9P4VQY6_9PEZI|nr:hypothetical protein M501DRAFT_1015429 [Patellaria atrata CBS 101060]